MAPYVVGVLALQGGFVEQMHMLQHFRPGISGLDVRDADALARCDALIIPGGESSVMRKVAIDMEIIDALRKFVSDGKPVWGICAGMILLSDHIDNENAIVGGLDLRVVRNFFGRQSNSSLRAMRVLGSAKEAGCADVSHFIRAPALEASHVGKDIEILASVDDTSGSRPVAARKGGLLVTAFHPEISSDSTWHAYFLREVCGRKSLIPPAALPIFGPNALCGDASSDEGMAARGEAEALVAAARLGPVFGSTSVKRAMPRFLQGGVIMDVVNAEQARVAEAAGACSVMALERIPADIKKDGGIARMSDPLLIQEILNTVSIPVMAKARIGHTGEAAILDALDVDMIDESEVLTPADEVHHIRKSQFRVPFVCGAKDLGEALRRIGEGAALIRLKGNAGTGNVLHAVRHARSVFSEIRKLQSMDADEVYAFAKEISAPLHLVQQTRALGRLPVVTFAAGGVATPADVSLMMSLGCDGVFVGSGIFKGENPAERARAMVLACTYWQKPLVIAKVSSGLGKAMVGILDNGETYNYVADSKL